MNDTHIPPDLLRRAKALYTQQAYSLTNAAKAAGVKVAPLRAIARSEDWAGQRRSSPVQQRGAHKVTKVTEEADLEDDDFEPGAPKRGGTGLVIWDALPGAAPKEFYHHKPVERLGEANEVQGECVFILGDVPGAMDRAPTCCLPTRKGSRFCETHHARIYRGAPEIKGLGQRRRRG